MRRHKFGVAQAEDRTADGIVFHSKREMEHYRGFKVLLNCGKIAKLELQVRFPLYAAKQEILGDRAVWLPEKIATYIADFVVTENDGVKRIYDSKGMVTPLFRMKMKIFQANYPHLRVVTL